VRDCHFMLQKEVVDRLAAAPGSKIYGRLSVMIQYRFNAEKLFNVPAGAFRPAPQVESAFVRLTPYAQLPWPARDEQLLSAIVNRAFTLRRKTLRNALTDFVDADQLRDLSIDPGLRPEQLPVEAFVRIANAVAARPPHRDTENTEDTEKD